MILSKKHDFPLITVQSFDFLYICRNSLHKQEDLFIKTELIRHENKNIFIVFGKSMIMIILCLLINMYLFVHGAGRKKRVNIFKTAYPMKQLIGYENGVGIVRFWQKSFVTLSLQTYVGCSLNFSLDFELKCHGRFTFDGRW